MLPRFFARTAVYGWPDLRPLGGSKRPTSWMMAIIRDAQHICQMVQHETSKDRVSGPA
jgi:hypothetical protein